jgi:hypothetical protein
VTEESPADESLPGTHRVTLGADKGCDARDFVAELRHMEITPHVAQNDANRSSAVDERTTRHTGCQLVSALKKRHNESDVVKYADQPILTEDMQNVDDFHMWFVKLKEEALAPRRIVCVFTRLSCARF